MSRARACVTSREPRRPSVLPSFVFAFEPSVNRVSPNPVMMTSRVDSDPGSASSGHVSLPNCKYCTAFLQSHGCFREKSEQMEIFTGFADAAGSCHSSRSPLTIDKKNFLGGVHEDPSLALRIVQTMSHRIRDLTDRLAHYEEPV